MNVVDVVNDVVSALSDVGVAIYNGELDSPKLPCIWVRIPYQIDYDFTHGRVNKIYLSIIVAVPKGHLQRLYTLLSIDNDGSVIDRLKAVSTDHIATIQLTQASSFDEGDALAYELQITITTKGN